MACGCGRKATASAPHAGATYGTSMLTTARHVGAASHPATNQAGVTVGADPLDGITGAMRSAVASSHVLAFPAPHGMVPRGTVRRAGAVIVPATTAVPVVSVKGYGGVLPFDSQPIIQKPAPWKGARNG